MSDNICSICLGEIENQIELVCKHMFCSDCISRWVKDGNSSTCPLCRSTAFVKITDYIKLEEINKEQEEINKEQEEIILETTKKYMKLVNEIKEMFNSDLIKHVLGIKSNRVPLF